MPKEVKVGTTRRVVRERYLTSAHLQPDGPAVRPYHPNVRAYDPKFRNLTAEIAKAAEEKSRNHSI
jgi:hypothetical protein